MIKQQVCVARQQVSNRLLILPVEGYKGRMPASREGRGGGGVVCSEYVPLCRGSSVWKKRRRQEERMSGR